MVKKNTEYLTILSVLSAIAVVYMHAQFAFYAFSDSRYWFTTNMIRAIMYFCVPIFFMISGATLIDYKERYSTKEFFLKRIKKVVIPFFIWSIIALIYCILMGKVKLENLTFVTVINGILNAKYQDVYWYFPVCISIYLCLPLFASIDKNMKKSVLSYLAVITFILNILLPFVISVFNLNIVLPIKVYVCLNYIFYVIVGYLLSKYDLKKSYKFIIYILGIFSLLLSIFGTYYYSINQGKIVYTFLGYDKLPCILYSISVFVFVKDIGPALMKSKLFSKFIHFLSRYTFSIYLIHMFIREMMVKFLNLDIISIIYRVLSPIPIIIVCILITWLIRKIKFVRNIVPE